jgi:hypothetical protein
MGTAPLPCFKTNLLLPAGSTKMQRCLSNMANWMRNSSSNSAIQKQMLQSPVTPQTTSQTSLAQNPKTLKLQDPLTCHTCVSTGMQWCWSSEKSAMQRATFGPIPGSEISSATASSRETVRRFSSHWWPPSGLVSSSCDCMIVEVREGPPQKNFSLKIYAELVEDCTYRD